MSAQSTWLEQVPALNLTHFEKMVMKQWVLQKDVLPDCLPSKMKQQMEQWSKSGHFKNFAREQLQQIQTTFMLSSIVQVITETLVCFFINALLRSAYVVNFSVDALVAVIALALLIRNLMMKYRSVSCVGKIWDYIGLDGSALVLAVLSKFLLPANLDIGLLIFMVSYFAQKRKFETSIKHIKI